MNKKLSVVVPVFKVEQYLRKTVESILSQTLKDIEIILVDDCSPDSSPALCDVYAQKYKQIKVVHKTKNEGLGMACNTGIEHANGEYIAFCDSDDWLDSDMYSEMIRVAEQYSADCVYTGLKRVDDAGNILGFMDHPDTLQIYNNKEKLNSLILDMIASTPADRAIRHIQVSAKVVLYKKSVIDKYNLQFVSERVIPSEDQCFNLSFLAHCQSACVLPESYYNYRINQNSISLQVREDLFERTKLLYDYTEKLCADNHIEGAKLRIDRMLIDYSRNFLSNICKSNLPVERKKEIIDQTCKDIIWERVWSKYPISAMWWKHRIFAYAMKYRCNKLVYILAGK